MRWLWFAPERPHAEFERAIAIAEWTPWRSHSLSSRSIQRSLYSLDVPTPPGQSAFLLKISLDDVTPTVWRRVLVPGSIRVAKLHAVFQTAMGWTDSHLHSFTIGDTVYGMHFDDYPDDEIDEKDVTVQQALDGHRRFSYEYDFGDSWDHTVIVEDFIWSRKGLKHAVCLDGGNACPPEDCGGTFGYSELVEVLADPEDEEHDAMMLWVGGQFDASAFDLIAINIALQHVG